MPDFSLEDDLGLGEGELVAGIDEVGRGPLAGPVTAAAVVIDRARCGADLLSRIDDSKRLKPTERAGLARELKSVCHIGIGWVERTEIDRINILQATMLAMRKAATDLQAGLDRAIAGALVDGNRDPDLPCATHLVIKGDGKSLSIAAASIIAKVARDERMAALAARHPGYGWERNAGYGTREHLDALTRLGPTPEHRRSFAPVRAVAQERESA